MKGRWGRQRERERERETQREREREREREGLREGERDSRQSNVSKKPGSTYYERCRDSRQGRDAQKIDNGECDR